MLAPDCKSLGDDEGNSSYSSNFSNLSSDAPGWPPFSEFLFVTKPKAYILAIRGNPPSCDSGLNYLCNLHWTYHRLYMSSNFMGILKFSNRPLSHPCELAPLSKSMLHSHHIYIFTDGRHCKTLIGAVDYSWLFTYAIFLFVRYSSIIPVHDLQCRCICGYMLHTLHVFVTVHAVLLLSKTVRSQ